MSDLEEFQEQMRAAVVPRLLSVPALPALGAEPAALLDPENIPPRRWLMGTTAIRGYISLMVAPGGVGKTTYALTAALACASGRRLLGDNIFGGGAPAWVFNLEDPLDETNRRVAAAMIHHGIRRDELAGRLFLNSGRDRRLLMAAQDEAGNRLAFPDKPRVIELAREHGMGLIVVDPFINSHELDENSNPHMNAAARAWAEVADAADCAVMLVHHTRKGAAGQTGDIEGSRGGKALSDAARVGLTLAAMSPEEAERSGVAPAERWRHVRLDDAKANLAPLERAKWFRLVGVNLGNGTPEYPNGDNVQAIEAWSPPTAFGDMTDGELNAVLDRIEAGLGGGRLYGDSKRGNSGRWAGQILVEEHGRTEEQAKAILAAWFRSGLLEKVTYRNGRDGRDEEGLRVDATKRPGTGQDR